MRSKIRAGFGIIKRWCHNSGNGPSVGILGVPFDKGQSQKGVGNGPAAIRNLGLIQRLKEIGKLSILGKIFIQEIEGNESLYFLAHSHRQNVHEIAGLSLIVITSTNTIIR